MLFKKKVVTTLIFAVLTLLTLQAQRPGGSRGGGSPEERAAAMTERMSTELDLSAAQSEKIKGVNLEFAQKMQEKRAAARASGDRESMRELMKVMREEQAVALKKYLTTEQIEKWDKIQAERPNRGAPGRKRGNKSKKEKKS